MPRDSPAGRFEALPLVPARGILVPLAAGYRARILGLAGLDRDDAPPGLLIPRCASVHTFGMRFRLDLHFLDRGGEVVSTRRAVGPRRIASQRGAAAVLEVPSPAESGDFGG